MKLEEAAPGTFSAEARLTGSEGSFLLVRNKDRSQTFHPQVPGQTEPTFIIGPEFAETDYSWTIEGQMGDVFRITFQRSLDHGVDTKTISWQKLRTEELTEDEL